MYFTIKNIFVFLFYSFLPLSWGNVIDYKKLEIKKGLYYHKSSEIPYTGEVSGKINGKIVKGKKEGEYIKYYKNGKILSKANFKKNKLNGRYLEFYYNGNMLTERYYENGILEGEASDYYSMGQLLSKRNYNDGILNGQYLFMRIAFRLHSHLSPRLL